MNEVYFMSSVIASVIAAKLSELGQRPADLCRKTGIQSSLMSNYLKGLKSPTLTNASAIASALGITLDELTGRETTDRVNEEALLLSNFRRLDSNSKCTVIATVEKLYLLNQHSKQLLCSMIGKYDLLDDLTRQLLVKIMDSLSLSSEEQTLLAAFRSLDSSSQEQLIDDLKKD